jgi:hypothetical protein
VSEFRTKYPGKAIVYSRRGAKFADWAIFMGGGSLASLPVIRDIRFLEQASEMKSIDMNIPSAKQYVLGKEGLGYIIYSESQHMIVDLSTDHKSYRLKWINPSTGEIQNTEVKVTGGKLNSLDAPFPGPAVAWLTGKI